MHGLIGQSWIVRVLEVNSIDGYGILKKKQPFDLCHCSLELNDEKRDRESYVLNRQIIF